MRFFKHLLGIVFGFSLIVFCLFNRELVAVTFSPIHDSYALPLYAVILGSAVFGFFWGALAVFFSHHGIRQDRHRQKRRIRALEKEMQSMKPPQITRLHESSSQLLSRSS